MSNFRFHKQRKRSWPTEVGDLPAAVLAALGGGPERARLSLLWSHWDMVLGPELAPVAMPLGHHKDMLLLGAEDAMLMQELHLQSGEILERVNAFMEAPFFRSIKVSLVMGKAVLDRQAGPLRPHGFGHAEPEDAAGGEVGSGTADSVDGNAGDNAGGKYGLHFGRRSLFRRPEGIFLKNMDPASAVARCYARFAGCSFSTENAENASLEGSELPQEKK